MPLLIGIPLYDNNYDNNYNNNNYNNNRGNNSGNNRGNNRRGRGGGRGTGRRRCTGFNSCRSKAVGIPPLPEFERFANYIKDRHPDGPYGTVCVAFQSDNCHSPNGQKYCSNFHVCRKCGGGHPGNRCRRNP